MWDAIKFAVRNANCIFGKAGEGRKDCPRCRGSGLLVSNRRLHQSLAPSNEPCWFCEGVGALPIVGLKGFVLARAISSLQNCKQYPLLAPPLNLGLHHGKYPETRCSVITFKPREEVANLVHDFSSAPSWLGPSVKRASFKGEPTEFQGTHQGHTKSIKTKGGSSKYSSSSQTRQSCSKFSRLFQVPNRRNIQVSPSAPSLSPNNYLQSITMCSMATAEQKSDKGFHRSDGFQTGLFGSTLYCEITSQSLGNDANGQIHLLSEPSASAMQTDALNGSKSSFPFVLGLGSDTSIAVSKIYRRPRKKRNRIREKAQKEALKRARKIVGMLKFQKDELPLAEQNKHSDVNPFIKRHPSEVRSISHEPSTGGQSLLFANASKDALVGKFSSFGQSWVDLLTSSGAQEFMRAPFVRHWPSKPQLGR